MTNKEIHDHLRDILNTGATKPLSKEQFVALAYAAEHHFREAKKDEKSDQSGLTPRG